MPDIYVFKSSWDFTLNLKPITKKGIPDGAGGFTHMVESPPISVRFVGGTCVIDEAQSKRTGVDVETLKSWILSQAGYGKRYWLVEDLPKEKIEEIKKESRKSITKVIPGVRTTKN